MPSWLALILFCATYALLAVGRFPGLALDRTGIALLGAMAFLTIGEMDLEAARLALDVPTLVVLFAMMLLSAQYHLSGLYGRIGAALVRLENPRLLLLGTLAVSAGLAAVLTNDVIAFALTPLVTRSVLRRRLAPFPYLMAIAIGTNLGSALTPIGNPQNILIAQRLGLEFLPFVAYAAPPVLVSLAVAYFVLARRLAGGPTPDASLAPGPWEEVPYDSWQAAKAVLLTAAAVVLFVSPVEAAHAALLIAGIILTSRKMHTRTVLSLVDWHMLALFVGLFVVTEGFDRAGWTTWLQSRLQETGWSLDRPAILAPVVSVLGIAIGNVPATMLLLRLLPGDSEVGYLVALASTFVGNAVLMGSVANLIVAEQARPLGVSFGFREHARIGLPITLASLLVLAIYVWLFR